VSTAPLVIATGSSRLADLPAGPLLAVAALAPARPAALAAVRIAPAAAPGRVVLEALSNFQAVRLEVAGTAARAVTVPRWALMELRRRHREADRLVIEPMGPVGLRLVSLAEAIGTAAVCGEVAELPELPTWEPLMGEPPGPLLLDPALLAAALAGLREASPQPVEVRWLDHAVLGLSLELLGGEVAGGVALARMARTAREGET
jgi:hypothetical protein